MGEHLFHAGQLFQPGADSGLLFLQKKQKMRGVVVLAVPFDLFQGAACLLQHPDEIKIEQLGRGVPSIAV